MATKRLLESGYPVLLVGKSPGVVEEHFIQTKIPDKTEVDTITMYLNPMNQKSWYNDILKMKPRRIIFNPGTENPELEKLALDSGIEVQEACTLVLLSLKQYDK
jgi:predicted CoA-binding protein